MYYGRVMLGRQGGEIGRFCDDKTGSLDKARAETYNDIDCLCTHRMMDRQREKSK